MLPALLASIPSPPEDVIRIGPVPLHMYGLMIAIGVLVAAKVTEVRWVRRGHDAKEFGDLVVWLVLGGVVGARLYHVVTDYQLFRDDPLRVLRIWEGGLAIWGAVLGGALVAVVMTRRRHLDLGDLLDCAAPALAFAQAIGRWGNWFNQELFGRPTTLPWGLEIDPVHRPAGYERYATFHPTFLYESLWCLALAKLLLLVARRVRLAPGRLFFVYVAGYCAMQFFIEGLRIDPAKAADGLRLNQWVSLVLLAAALATLARRGARLTRSPGGDPDGRSPRPAG